ncbi:MAG: DUF47 family protein [Anaerolineaceae bacterium]|nr:DUF47 family protein [Anaerolineaceae bacterium]
MAKKDNNYFHMFIEISNDAIEAAYLLEKTVKNYDPELIEEQNTLMHSIEHAGDVKKHEMRRHLISEFITPIEREDIDSLSHTLDNVLDTIEEVYQMFYMYNVQKMRPEAVAFVDLIVRSTEGMKACFDEFEDFRKSNTISERIVEVNEIEELADDLYFTTMRKLFTDGSDSVEVLVWLRIFDRLERVCDACEGVAETIGSVIMKNS